MLMLIIMLLTALCALILQKIHYEKTDYFKDTHVPFFTLRRDTGKLGEYLTYRTLRKLPGEKRFLFNCYLPREDAATTETDLILLHSSGAYLLESKNYSGWIFGSETNRSWTQTLPQGGGTQKNHFLNPIIQNEIHMKWFKQYLADVPELPCYSIIVFSKRCTLKNISLMENSAHIVVRRPDLLRAAKATAAGKTRLTSKQINALYDRLYPLTQTTEEQKMEHIHSINQKRSHQQINSSSTCPQANTPLPPQEGSRICPRCGAALVQKTAQKGARAGKAFWGCSRFPACRYLQNIEE